MRKVKASQAFGTPSAAVRAALRPSDLDRIRAWIYQERRGARTEGANPPILRALDALEVAVNHISSGVHYPFDEAENQALAAIAAKLEGR